MSFRSVCSVLLVVFFQAITAHAQISKGNQIIINRGLLVEGMVTKDDVFHLDTYTNANYTAINWFHESDMSRGGDAPGYPWGRWVGNDTQMPPQGIESSYLSQLVNLSLSDEPNLLDSTIFNNMVNWFTSTASNFPNTILYINNWGGQIEDGTLSSFISQAHPDLISFDTYPFKSVYDTNAPDHIGPVVGGPNQYYAWYSELRRYRAWGSTFNIPFGYYRQTFHAVEDYAPYNVYRDPSASELRLNTFAGLAFNAKMIIDFTYNTGASSLFTKPGGDSYPTPLYYEMQDINLRARNLGKTLVRLKPAYDMHNLNDVNPPPGPTSDNPNFADGYVTSMMFVKGKYLSGGTTNLTILPNSFLDDAEAPNQYSWWEFQKNDPYLNGWGVSNTGTVNNGLPGEVIISWFKPLDESFDGATYTNETYMMVVNALTETNATPVQCSQRITLNFMDTFSGAIEILNSSTGIAEYQVLPIVNTRRQLVLNLNGGDAALFKFSDGAPFIGVAPVITGQPGAQTKPVGDSATFSVTANDPTAIGYQWRRNGSNINAATNSSFTINSVQAADAGDYTVVLTNSYGSVTSSIANLNVLFPPQISIQPQDQTINPGATATFSVTASASPAPAYQWRMNGMNIVGATSSSLLLSNVQSMDSANYSVVITNAGGTLISSNALLIVTGPPVITSQPQNRSAIVGGGVTFNVSAVGVAPLIYRWRKNGNNLSDSGNIIGSANASLTLNNIQASDFATYSVLVSNNYGAVLSIPVTLSLATQPTIQTQPQSRTNNTGTTASFNVVASGGGLTYQWQHGTTNLVDGGSISGANTDTLLINSVLKSDVGNYTVVVGNAAGTVTSSAATLTVFTSMPWREPFNYSAGSALAGQTNSDGLVWADVGTSTAGTNVTVEVGNLSIAGLSTSYGNSIRFGGLGKSARFSFSPIVSSGTLYFSFALKVLDLTGASASGGFFAGFNNSTGTQANQPTVVGARLYLRATGGGFNLGVAKNSDVDWFWDPRVFTTNETLFIVGSYTLVSGSTNNDTAALWINPSPTDFGAVTAPSSNAITASTGTDLSGNLSSFVFFKRSATAEPAVMIADDLRIGTTWASVTPAAIPPKVNSMTILSDGRVRLQGGGISGNLIIETSRDLTSWIQVKSLFSAGGAFEYIEPASYAYQRFYRIRFLP